MLKDSELVPQDTGCHEVFSGKHWEQTGLRGSGLRLRLGLGLDCVGISLWLGVGSGYC